MSGNVKLVTPSNGSVTLSTPDTASAVTVTIPATTDTLVNLTSTQTLTNKTLTSPTISGGSVAATSGPDSTQLSGNRNKIINGAMMIDQRNAGAAVTVNLGSNVYITDRFYGSKAGTVNNFTVQQITGGPAGFSKSLLLTMGTGVTPATTDYAVFGQSIEGLNCTDLNWGTASAKSITLSFWVYSSVSGTFGIGFRNNASNRGYIASYSITSVNTWTYITITIPGDISGTWTIDNTAGIQVLWDLGVGSTYSTTAGSWQGGNYFGLTGGTKLAATTGATFYITGVQLEKGATATPFENRLYGTELALCQRYYCYWGGTTVYARVATGFTVNSTSAEIEIPSFPVQMRAAPSLGYSAVGDWSIGVYNNGYVCSSISIGQATPINCAVALGSTGMTANYPAILNANNTTNARLTFSAEL